MTDLEAQNIYLDVIVKEGGLQNLFTQRCQSMEASAFAIIEVNYQ